MFSWRGELLPRTGDLVGSGKEHFKDLLNLIGTSSEENLKTWGWFATKYDVAGMRVSSSQSEAMVLFQTQPSLGFTETDLKKKFSSSSEGAKALLMSKVMGERTDDSAVAQITTGYN